MSFHISKNLDSSTSFSTYRQSFSKRGQHAESKGEAAQVEHAQHLSSFDHSLENGSDLTSLDSSALNGSIDQTAENLENDFAQHTLELAADTMKSVAQAAIDWYILRHSSEKMTSSSSLERSSNGVQDLSDAQSLQSKTEEQDINSNGQEPLNGSVPNLPQYAISGPNDVKTQVKLSLRQELLLTHQL